MKENIAWITGASSGIGKELAYKFSNNADNLVLTARSEDKLIKIKDELKSNKGKCEISSFSISSNEDVLSFNKDISSKFNIDCLINNAGITAFKLVNDHTIDEIQQILEVNLLGSIYATKAVLPGMIERKSGTIINIISVAAEKVFTHSSVYAASKAGLLAFTKSLREEVREHNIRVINIIPGATKTPIWPESSAEKFGERMMKSSDLADMIYNLYENKSTVVPEEVVLRPILGDL
ncbi:MAG: SDR family NAD(P)-dependent oxidoreductase [Melioribacteraceae bacterium]|nr:SDR family NAD(P)-dependent oxidoreductase [Melioribacteraceae bacterium]